ncbi:PREDICTED: uncharacterized protein LOC106821088 [Priapulus caudatus]|uniref:Uncharacterized protein LOC106821088 n=1 Tax=Priapulus caudatus TaxID=37621 RepID=A0ABM1F9V5_PRICU|nr:PREDICTED: uncharacterized protein LOC106821088 [Priapulus caudatus]
MCDDMTGWCLKCANHTRGSSCEVCDVGYAGNPAAGIPCVLAEAMSVDGSTPGILAGIVVMCSIFVVLVGGFVYYKRRDGMQRQNPYYTIELKDDYVWCDEMEVDYRRGIASVHGSYQRC